MSLTKAQLAAQVAELTRQRDDIAAAWAADAALFAQRLAAGTEMVRALRRELDAYQVAQRPSRTMSQLVTVRGVQFIKVRDNHTRVVTYKPVATGEGEAAARSALKSSVQGHARTVAHAAGVYPS